MHALRLFLITLVLASLAACSSAGPTSGTPGTGAVPTRQPPPALTLWPSPTADLGAEAADLRGVHLRLWHAFVGESATAFETQVALFNTMNEWGITVYPERQPEYRALYEALQSRTREELPDLVVALPEQILALADADRVTALNPYLADGRWGLNEETVQDIPPAFWQQDEVNGRRWAIPLARSARFLFYNLTWARQLGFDHPPANADEFQQQVCAANAALRADADVHNDGYGGWLVDTHWQTAYNWLLAFGGGVLENGTYHFESAANQKALTFLKSLYDEHCAWLPLDLAPAEAFARRLALVVSGDVQDLSEFETTLRRFENTDAWTLIPYPGPRQQAVSTYGVSLAILRTTPSRQLAAWLFLRWLLAPERQARWARESGFFPLRLSALAALKGDRSAHPPWDAALTFLPSMQGTPQVASWRLTRYILADGLTHIFRLNLPPEQVPAVLEEIQTTAQELESEK